VAWAFDRDVRSTGKLRPVEFANHFINPKSSPLPLNRARKLYVCHPERSFAEQNAVEGPDYL